MTRHAQITQNNKLSISLQYLKKELGDEVDFLHAEKHESLPKFPKERVCNIFTISQEKVKDGVNFFDADKHQSFLKVYFSTLGIKVFYKVDLIINGYD